MICKHSDMRDNDFLKQQKYFHVTVTYNVSSELKIFNWLKVQKIIKTYALEFEVEIQCLVMMDTHTHLIVKTNNSSVQPFSESLQKHLKVDASLENIYKAILNYSQYLNTYKYIYRNPVEAKLSRYVEDYEFSSLLPIIGRGHLNLRVYDQIGLVHNPFQVLNWLNSSGLFKHSKLSWLEIRSQNSHS